MTSRPRHRFALGVALSVASLSGQARANGKFPEAGQLVVAPDDASHMAVRTTFGVLDSSDGGQTWQWICEAAVGYEDYEPPLALGGDGALLLALQEGIARSPNGCSWAPAGGGLADRNVVDLSVSKASPEIAVAISFDASQATTQLWRSSDGGASWSSHGSSLPAGFVGYTLDLAPSDPTTIYLSGLVGDPLAGVVLRSTDDGQTWASFSVPGSDVVQPPYIGAMDPLDDATFYVRLASEQGRLLGTFDAGETWTELFVGEGFMRGLAVSPDGSQVILGGEKDGVWRADVPAKSEAGNASAWQFEKTSDFTPFCLTWLEGGDVLACGHVFFNDGIGVARSTDAGASFEEVFCFGEIDEVLDCGGGESLEAVCADELATLDDQVPAGTCGGAPAPPTTSSGGAGGQAAEGGAPPAAAPGSTGSSGGCSTDGRESRGAALGASLIGLALLLRRRRERR